MRRIAQWTKVTLGTLACVGSLSAQTVKVGFGEADITPDVEARPVWIAGYGQNRKATGVHDPLYSRAVVFLAADKKIALVSVDLVGLQYPSVVAIREQLPDFDYVLVSSTHTHEGPDVVGLWGPSLLESGVDPEYLASVEKQVVASVRSAEKSAAPAKAAYGTAQDTANKLLRDSRLPIVYDDILRVTRFTHAENGSDLGLMVQWNNHPEALGPHNPLITCDFPYATIRELQKQYQCPVAYFTGTVGGLMTTPREIIDDRGRPHREGNFEYADVYGLQLARLAQKAIDAAKPIALTPIRWSARKLGLPMENFTYHLLATNGVLGRDAYAWTGDPYELGAPISRGKPAQTKAALQTEVCFLELGDLKIVGIPGEIYPELVYGKYQEPVEPNVDFPDAPLEKSVVEIVGDAPWHLFGLANDEVGYIVPKRQWDFKKPFAYGRDKAQYGEINSVGPDTAPLLMKALEDCANDVRQKEAP